MTNRPERPNPIDEAVRVLRGPSFAYEDAFDAIASALEELSGKGDVGGEADETQMCPRFGTADHALNDCALCLGTGRVPKEPADTVHFRFVLDGVEHDDIRYILDKMPPEQRTAALAPYRDPVVEGLHIRSKEAEQRAEAAEARAAEAERERDALIDANGGADGYEAALRWPWLQRERVRRVERERRQALERTAKIEKELEAARARVGELETTIRGVLDEWRTGHSMHWDREGTHGANCPACKLDGDARHCLRKALEPTPSAPTPPGYCECGTTEHAAESTGGVRFCGKCGRGYSVAPTPAVVDSAPTNLLDFANQGGRLKESPPRDSVREPAGATMSDAERAAFDKGVEHERHGIDGWHWLSDAEDRAYWRGRESVKEVSEREQRKGQAEATPEATHDGKQGVRAVPAPEGGARKEEVAPPGLTPEDAEAGARKAYDLRTSARREMARNSTFNHWPPTWDELDSGDRDSEIAAYRFAHAEGAKAAKAKGGTRVADSLKAARADTARLREKVSFMATQFGADMQGLAYSLQCHLEAMAAELEGKA